MSSETAKPKVATIWLDGCSGCHMSLLDTDERLVDLVNAVDVIYSPIVDPKQFPEDVTVTLVEGAVSSEHDREMALIIRKNSKLVVSLGDCAVTGNVPAMRNAFKTTELLDRAYKENAAHNAKHPTVGLSPLIEKAQPLHAVIDVDLFLPGCPPPADAIFTLITDILAGRETQVTELTRFGR
ncbi:NADP oxidoreductase [Planctomycetales bacterium ZRK34]|nr:NADP oxidoreductase [Planctomycetales bacterium ZRK34]